MHRQSSNNHHPQASETSTDQNKEYFEVNDKNPNDLGLEFQRSAPGSREANKIYTRFRDEIGFGRNENLRPKGTPTGFLFTDEYFQILEDSKQDTELRLVSFLRKDFEVSSQFIQLLLSLNSFAGAIFLKKYISLKKSKKNSKAIFNPEEGNISHFASSTLKYRHKDNIAKHQGLHSYVEKKIKKTIAEISLNQKVNNYSEKYNYNEEIQDKITCFDSITFKSKTEVDELIQLIIEDPEKAFSSDLLKKREDIDLKTVSLLKLQHGYSQEEIAQKFGVDQSSISRFLKKLEKDPLLARIKQFLDLP